MRYPSAAEQSDRQEQGTLLAAGLHQPREVHHLLPKVLYDYVRLFDVYKCAINPGRLEERIRSVEAWLFEQFVLMSVEAFRMDRELETYPFERDPDTGCVKAPLSENLATWLRRHNNVIEPETDSTNDDIAGRARGPEKP